MAHIRKSETDPIKDKLHWNESLLRAINDSTHMGYLAVDSRTDRVLYYNKSFLKIWKLESIEDKIITGELNDSEIIGCCRSLIKDFESYIKTIGSFKQDLCAQVNDHEIELTDGRFIRSISSTIGNMDDAYLGTLIMFEDITEKKRAAEQLEYRHKADQFIKSVSTEFINRSNNETDQVITSASIKICEFTGMDYCKIFLLNDKKTLFINAYNSSSGGRMRSMPIKLWPWCYRKLLRFENIYVKNINDLPSEADIEKSFWLGRNTTSVIIIPMTFRNSLIGFMHLESVAETSGISKDTVVLLQLMANIFSNAIIRQKEEINLIHNEEKFRILVQNSTDLISIIDKDGYVVYNSPSVQQLLGYEPAERIGKLTFDFMHPADVNNIAKLMENFRDGGMHSAHFQVRLRNSGNSWVLFECVATNQLNNNTIRGVVVNSRDITEQKRFEEVLRNSRNFLDRIINASADPIFVKDQNHRFILLNDAFCRFTGFKKEVMTGKTDHDFFPKAEANIFVENDKKVFLSGRENINEEIITDSSGIEHFIVTRKTLYYDESGEKYLVGTIREETVRKQMEINLRKAFEREKELNEMKSRFVSTVSHEYRTPLTSILSSAELLELFGTQMTSEKRSEHYTKIKNAVDYMIEMLDDVLVINRAESGRLEFKPENIELVEFCQKLINEIIVTSTRYEIHFSSEKPPVEVLLDRKLLRYIIVNLLSNALKYSQKGTPIKFIMKSDEENISIDIIDMGIGIPLADQSRLFEPFFRAKNAANIPGTGLGLSIVKNCVTMLNGDISFESSAEAGTRFSVLLPRRFSADLIN